MATHQPIKFTFVTHGSYDDADTGKVSPGYTGKIPWDGIHRNKIRGRMMKQVNLSNPKSKRGDDYAIIELSYKKDLLVLEHEDSSLSILDKKGLEFWRANRDPEKGPDESFPITPLYSRDRYVVKEAEGKKEFIVYIDGREKFKIEEYLLTKIIDEVIERDESKKEYSDGDSDNENFPDNETEIIICEDKLYISYRFYIVSFPLDKIQQIEKEKETGFISNIEAMKEIMTVCPERQGAGKIFVHSSVGLLLCRISSSFFTVKRVDDGFTLLRIKNEKLPRAIDDIVSYETEDGFELLTSEDLKYWILFSFHTK